MRLPDAARHHEPPQPSAVSSATAARPLRAQPSRRDVLGCLAAPALVMYLPDFADRYWPELPLGTDCRTVWLGDDVRRLTPSQICRCLPNDELTKPWDSPCSGTPARRAAVDALVAGPIADHDRAAVRAGRRVRGVEDHRRLANRQPLGPILRLPVLRHDLQPIQDPPSAAVSSVPCASGAAASG